MKKTILDAGWISGTETPHHTKDVIAMIECLDRKNLTNK